MVSRDWKEKRNFTFHCPDLWIFLCFYEKETLPFILFCPSPENYVAGSAKVTITESHTGLRIMPPPVPFLCQPVTIFSSPVLLRGKQHLLYVLFPTQVTVSLTILKKILFFLQFYRFPSHHYFPHISGISTIQIDVSRIIKHWPWCLM